MEAVAQTLYCSRRKRRPRAWSRVSLTFFSASRPGRSTRRRVPWAFEINEEGEYDWIFSDINGEEKVVQKSMNACLDRLHAMCPSLFLSLSRSPNKVSKCNTQRITHTYINTRTILSIDDRILRSLNWLLTTLPFLILFPRASMTVLDGQIQRLNCPTVSTCTASSTHPSLILYPAR